MQIYYRQCVPGFNKCRILSGPDSAATKTTFLCMFSCKAVKLWWCLFFCPLWVFKIHGWCIQHLFKQLLSGFSQKALLLTLPKIVVCNSTHGDFSYKALQLWNNYPPHNKKKVWFLNLKADKISETVEQKLYNPCSWFSKCEPDNSQRHTLYSLSLQRRLHNPADLYIVC